MRFSSFLSGGFTTVAVLNPLEKTGKTHLCIGSHNKEFQKLIFTNTKAALHSLILLSKILADIRPMEYKLSCCGSIWFG